MTEDYKNFYRLKLWCEVLQQWLTIWENDNEFTIRVLGHVPESHEGKCIFCAHLSPENFGRISHKKLYDRLVASLGGDSGMRGIKIKFNGKGRKDDFIMRLFETVRQFTIERGQTFNPVLGNFYPCLSNGSSCVGFPEKIRKEIYNAYGIPHKDQRDSRIAFLRLMLAYCQHEVKKMRRGRIFYFVNGKYQEAK